MRLRKQGNYKSFFTNSFKTIRFTGVAPKTPELLDVAINDKCLAACFIPSTPVQTISGKISICEIKIGDLVSSYSENKKVFEYKEVYELFKNEYDGDIFEIKLEDNSIIRCTSNHKFLTNRGWIEAENLIDSDEFLDIF